MNHPVKQGEIAPSFVFDYEIFLSDLKIALMSADGAMELIDKIDRAINVLRGNIMPDEDGGTDEETCGFIVRYSGFSVMS